MLAVSLYTQIGRVAASQTRLPLSPHYNPQGATLNANSLGVFRNSHYHSLASFAVQISFSTSSLSLAGEYYLFPEILQYHSRQATLHTDCHRMQVHTPSHNPTMKQATHLGLRESWVRIACRCGLPNSLNSQYQPKAGRLKPTPGTSSMCPLTDF